MLTATLLSLSLLTLSHAAGYERPDWYNNLHSSSSQSEAHLYDFSHLQNLDYSVLPEYHGPIDNTVDPNRELHSPSWGGFPGLNGYSYGQDHGGHLFHPQQQMGEERGYSASRVQSMPQTVWSQQDDYVTAHEQTQYDAYLHATSNLNVGSHDRLSAHVVPGVKISSTDPYQHLHHDAHSRGLEKTEEMPPRASFSGINPHADPDDDFFQDAQVNNQMKWKVGMLWKRKGLWVGLHPRELAAGIAEIKVELGTAHAKAIGTLASSHVRKYASGQNGYVDTVQGWTKKFNKKMTQLEVNLARYHPEVGPEQSKLLVLAGVRFLQDRASYLGNCKRPCKEGRDVDKIDKRLDGEATSAWSVLEKSDELAAELQEQQRYDAQPYVSIETIERASRHIQHLIPSHSREDIADLLRRYMIKFLHKTPLEVDQFNKARHDWLKTVPYAITEAAESSE